MLYEQLENDIVARLTPDLSGVDVMALPEKPSEFNKQSKAKITVCYKNSKYGPGKSIGELSQEETAEFEIIIQAKLLRGPAGVYAFIQKVKSLLLGYKLTDTDRVYLVEQGISPENTTTEIFTHYVVVACKGVTVEEIEVNENEFE